MDGKHRFYYLVNFNKNHTEDGWYKNWCNDYDALYDANLKALQSAVGSLKITPNKQSGYTNLRFQRKVSCLKKEHNLLVNTLEGLEGVEYVKIL